MKFNKWTLGLAAIGVVSLSSAAQAEEKLNAVQSALSSTTISGYVDTSAQWNAGTGNDYLPRYKFGGPSKADGFNLNVVQLTLSKPLDESEWASGYRFDMWMGPDANTLGTQSNLSGDSSDFGIRQAYVALRTPLGNGIDWKFGVFDTIIGYESLEAGNNPNFTRSYGHSIEPQTHTGMLGTYRINDVFSVSAGVADTTGPTINDKSWDQGDNSDAESSKTYMGSIAITAPDSWGWAAGSTLYGGVVNGFSSSYEGTTTSWYAGGTLATPITGLKVGAAFDYLYVADAPGRDQEATWALGGYGSYQVTEKLSLHLRAEYIEDRADVLGYESDAADLAAELGEPIDFGPAKIFAVTTTAQYDLWKNVISRLEFRWDHSATGGVLFGEGTEAGEGGEVSVPDRKNAYMVALNLIYKF